MERSEVWTYMKQLQSQFQALERRTPPEEQDYRTCKWLYVELSLLMISMKKSLDVYEQRQQDEYADTQVRGGHWIDNSRC